MEMAMQPFIFVYHMVSRLMKVPKKILAYAFTGVLAVIDMFTKGDRGKKSTSKVDVNDKPSILAKHLNKEFNEENIASTGRGKKTSFRYTVKLPTGKLLKSSFEAYNTHEVELFLSSEGYEIVSIEPRKPYDIDLFTNMSLSTSELSFLLTQMSTYLKAGIPLIDAVRILAKQSDKPGKRKIYEKIVYELLMGENFSTALTKQGRIFPKLLINMVKTAEMTGDLASTLDDMAEYYTSIDKTRKQMLSAMMYPTIIFIIAIGVVAFILMFVVPQFVEMFENQGAELPFVTQFVIGVSGFLSHNYIWVILLIALAIIIYRGLYVNVTSFRQAMQTFYMRLPVIGNIIIYNEVTMFTKTFSSLLNHSVFITDSMEILSQLTNNEIYKNIIEKTIDNLGKGSKISEAFKGQWAFPIVAYEMLVTGEQTGQLGLMMEKVAVHYQELHKNAVGRIKALIEPVMIAFLAGIVGVIILSIIVPMFDIYGQIG